MTEKPITRKTPIIRWAGSKRKIIPLLVELSAPSFKRYVEPFCGSASLFFHLLPNRALLSDVNQELINTWNQIKHDNDIRKKLESIHHSKNNYYQIRKLDTKKLTKNERAVRFLYLNRYCFNGVYRTNQEGQFNVPMGTRTGGIPNQESFDYAAEKLHNARIVCCDYKKTLKRIKSDDFVYLDPPYSKTDKFTGEYGLNSFSYRELPTLIAELERIDKLNAKFMLSYRACGDIARLLGSKFNVLDLTVPRHIAGFKDSWQKAKEIIVRNYG